MKHLYFTIIISTLFSCTKKDSVKPIELEGRWKWIQTINEFYDPSGNPTNSITSTPDLISLFAIFRNNQWETRGDDDTLISSYKYIRNANTITVDRTGLGIVSPTGIIYGWSSFQVLELSEHTLKILSEYPYADGKLQVRCTAEYRR